MSDDAATPHDERLAAVLNRLLDDMENAGGADVEAAAREHPELAGELRELWAAAVLVDELAPTATNAALEREAVEPARRDVAQPGVFGDYELLEELGRGGMGIVYKARQRGLDRIVALKTLRAGANEGPAELVRFRQEAASAARLDHPHVVPVYEVGECDGQPFFTMQYVAGQTLAQRLADGPMPPREIAALLVPICDAIHEAHERGVLHRDLKPSNILIDAAGRPMVSDFGLAKRVEADGTLTHTGAILGTPTHMAPEQAAGSRGRVGPKSDVYSLGAILYQMLTGRPPLQGSTPMETVLMVLEQEPLPPRLLNPRADAALELVALKCLQKPPDLRYESARALGDDLRAYLANEPIAAQSGRLSEIVVRWLSETHHATVLHNWGLLWMWHSLALVITCGLTNLMQWRGVDSRWPYVALWGAGFGTWAVIFWTLRRRSGPVTFVERQIAHIWAGSIVASVLLFPVEHLLGLPVLSLAPVLALVSGNVFLVKAGMLTGAFYVQAAALYATALAMAALESAGLHVGISLFGAVSAACFFFPGLKYWRRSKAAM